MFRRRPLMRAAVVGGTAYYAGKKVSQSRAQTEAQNQQIADLQAQQEQQNAQQAAPAAPSQEDSVEKLKQLKGLLDQGVLTQSEFDLEKQKILQNM
jgi:membrane protease subunit (stomatin/prohibitin family)